jgi:nucleoside 2-deoxyribosyltransferase
MKKIYLANPYGFSESAKDSLLPELVYVLESMGAEVWEPFQRNNQVDFSKSGWAYAVGQADVNDVKNADAIFAVVNGIPPDEGVMVELGIGIALKKEIFLYRDDFRRCTDSEEYPLNLMIFTGLPRDSWREYYYTSVADITDQQKALWRWLKEEKC